MSARSASDYLSTLVNRRIEQNTLISLTSGQRARFLAWLDQSGRNPSEVDRLVGRPFTPLQLAAAMGVSAPAMGTPDREEAESVGLRSTRSGTGRRRGIVASIGAGGLGVDIQKIEEIVPWGAEFDFRSSPELTEIFSAREISYACAKVSPRETLAGLFAAKEAIIKAEPERAIRRLNEIEILPNESGVPSHGGFAISISHSGEYAVAVAMRLRESEVESAVPVSELEAHVVAASPADALAPGSMFEDKMAETGGLRRVTRVRIPGWIVIVAVVLVVAGIAFMASLHRG